MSSRLTQSLRDTVLSFCRSLSGQSTQRRRRRSVWNAAASEALEGRRLPATLIGTTQVKYQDIDGDDVTVTLSKPILTAANVNTIFTFDTGNVNGANTTKQQLRSINLLLAGAQGTNITTVATRNAVTKGDGLAALGQIISNRDLGTITIDGDLGRINAGDTTLTTRGVTALNVHSMGRFGSFTGSPNLESLIFGKLGSLTVKTDVQEADIRVSGGVNGQIGPITIGGSLIGGSTTNQGQILAEGNIGVVLVKGDILGGSASSSGFIGSADLLGLPTAIASLTVEGSVIGGAGVRSGSVVVNRIGPIKITGDLIGSSGNISGMMFSVGAMTSVTVDGSIIGGVARSTGGIMAGGALGAVIVGGDLIANTSFSGEESAVVVSETSIASVTIGGSMIGGGGEKTGYIGAPTVGPISIGGDLKGNLGATSGAIQAGSIGNVTLGGSLEGSFGSYSGMIVANTAGIGAISIGGDVVGGNAAQTGFIRANTNIASLTIEGSLLGGVESKTGRVEASGNIGPVLIKGDVEALSTDAGIDSATVRSGGTMGTVTVNGSIRGGAGSRSGSISSAQSMGAVTVLDNIIGNLGEQSGSISSVDDMVSVTVNGSVLGSAGHNSGQIKALQGALGPVIVKGDVSGGSGNWSGQVYAMSGIGTVTINGSIRGHEGERSGSVSTPKSIGTISLSGSVLGGAGERSGSIRAGENMGSVTIGQTLRGSSGESSGYINAKADMGNLTIRRVVGGSGEGSGTATSGLKIGNITINGNVEGGSGAGSGAVGNTTVFQAGNVLIKGSLVGGIGASSGYLIVGSPSVTVNGSVKGGAGKRSGYVWTESVIPDVVAIVKVQGNVSGGSGEQSGSVNARNVTTFTIGGSLIGGSGDSSGSIDIFSATTLSIGGNIQGGSASGAATLTYSGSVKANRIQNLLVGGSVIAGVDNTTGVFKRNGAIYVYSDIGSATIKGSLRGNSTHNVTISAFGSVSPTATADVAIGNLTVNRRVEYTEILAGLSPTGKFNADAQIGTITIDGDWYASSISAGVGAGLDSRYGTSDDVKYTAADVKDVATVSSKIGNLTIKGRAFGTTALGDNFGVVAENFGIININGNNIPLTAGNNNDDFFMGLNSQMLGADSRLNEI